MVIIKRMALVKHLMTPQIKRTMPNVKTKDAVCNELCEHMISMLFCYESFI